MQRELFKLGLQDLAKGLITAGIVGFTLPVLVMIQTPGFDIFNADWSSVGNVALNGALAGLASYLVKNFLSDEEGKFLGKIG